MVYHGTGTVIACEDDPSKNIKTEHLC